MDVELKITINNKKRNMKTLRGKVLFQKKCDGNDAERDCYNRIVEKKISEGKQGSGFVTLDGVERPRVLHDFYRMGEKCISPLTLRKR